MTYLFVPALYAYALFAVYILVMGIHRAHPGALLAMLAVALRDKVR